MWTDNHLTWIAQLGPLLDLEQAILILSDHRGVSELTAQGFLLALDAPGGGSLYPAFQFRPNGRPYTEIARILEIFHKAVETSYTVASWFVSPQDDLEGKTPAAWMQSGHEAERLYKAARHAAVRLRR